MATQHQRSHVFRKKLMLWMTLVLATLFIRQAADASTACILVMDDALDANLVDTQISRLTRVRNVTRGSTFCSSSDGTNIILRNLSTGSNNASMSFQSMVPSSALVSLASSAIKTVVVFHFAVDVAWLSDEMTYLRTLWPSVHAKSKFLVAPMLMPIRMWAITSQFASWIPDTSQIYLLDADPFSVGFAAGVMLSTVIRPASPTGRGLLSAVQFREYPETNRGAIGFAYGVRANCALCSVKFFDIEVAALAPYLNNSTLLFSALARSGYALFTPPLPKFELQKQRGWNQVLTANQTASVSSIIYDYMIAHAVANVSLAINASVLGTVLNDTITQSLDALDAAVVWTSDTSAFGAQSIRLVRDAFYTRSSSATVFSSQIVSPASLASFSSALKSSPLATSIGPLGQYQPSGVSDWSPPPIGYMWEPLKRTIADLGCLLITADVQFGYYGIFDPRFNAMVYLNQTGLNPVVHFKLVTRKIASNNSRRDVYAVYAVGGFNASAFDNPTPAAAAAPIILREMRVAINCSAPMPLSYTILQPWMDIPANSLARPTRIGHSAVAYKDSILIYGGTSMAGLDFRGLNQWNATTKLWNTVALGPYRHDHSSAVRVDAFGVPWLYLFGGSVGGTVLNDLTRFNLKDLTWHTVLESPIAAVDACMQLVGNRLLYYGGFGGARAMAAISLSTDETLVDTTNPLFGINVGLSCASVVYGSQLTIVSVAPGTASLHRLTLPLSLPCSTSDNKVLSPLGDSCVTCDPGFIADEVCRSCATSLHSLNPYAQTFCPTNDNTRETALMILSTVLPFGIVLAGGGVAMFFLLMPRRAQFPFRNLANAPRSDVPCVVIKVSVDGAPSLWMKRAKDMSASMDCLIAELRRLTVMYGCYEIMTTGEATLLTCKEPLDALRWAVHLFYGCETNEFRASLGSLPVRIVLHYGPVDCHESGGSVNASGLTVNQARMIANNMRQPLGVLMTEQFFAKVQDGAGIADASFVTSQGQQSSNRSNNNFSALEESFEDSNTRRESISMSSPKRDGSDSPTANAGGTVFAKSVTKPSSLLWKKGRDGVVMLHKFRLTAGETYALDFGGFLRMSLTVEGVTTSAVATAPSSGLGDMTSEFGQNLALNNTSSNTLLSPTPRPLQMNLPRDVPSLIRLRPLLSSAATRVLVDPLTNSLSIAGESRLPDGVTAVPRTDAKPNQGPGTPQHPSLMPNSGGSTSPTPMPNSTWETHPLISLDVLSLKELAGIAKIVERLYEAMLLPLCEEERTIVQEAVAEHLRLYVDSDPNSRQRNNDVAMRLLQIIDMLFIKEVVQTLSCPDDVVGGATVGGNSSLVGYR